MVKDDHLGGAMTVVMRTKNKFAFMRKHSIALCLPNADRPVG
jgi:hypothetical protein